MGSCCATVKQGPMHSKLLDQNNALIMTGSALRPEELENPPSSRLIFRGAECTEKENTGQERLILTANLPDPSFIETLGITVSCKKGLKSSSKNQDNFSVIFEKNILMIAVFDGHGIFGYEMSHYLHIILPHLIISHPKFPEDLDSILLETYLKCNTHLHQYFEDTHRSAELSGSTCSILIVKDSIIYSSNIGDSRGIFIDSTGKAQNLTIDHKPSIPKELERIIKCGGEVRVSQDELCSRIFVKDQKLPGICVSRAFGDSLAQSVGVTVEPDFNKKKIEAEDLFVVVCSDGVWEFVTDAQVNEVIFDAICPAKKLTEFAWQKWVENEIDAVDDITAIVLDLTKFNKFIRNLSSYYLFISNFIRFSLSLNSLRLQEYHSRSAPTLHGFH